MAFWLIAVAVLLAVAPLLQFLPSRRQRQQAALREAAALRGLFVEFRDLPLPPSQRERLSAADRQVLYYGRRLSASRARARASRHWWRGGEDWRGDGREPPPSIAADLPAGVLALGVSEASCGVYWREEGDVNCVDGIAAALARWAEDIEGP
jgi:hypothetical protein